MTAQGLGRRPIGGEALDGEPDPIGLGRRIIAPSFDSPTSLTSVAFFIDGQGSAVSTGFAGVVDVQFDGELIAGYLLLDQSGSIVVDVWRDTFANYPPTNADTITAGAELTISSATNVEDSILSGWTKRFTKGDVFGFNVDSITTATWCYVSLWARRLG